MGQMPTVGQAHPQYGVTRLQQCKVNSGVSLAAGVRLNVGIISAKEFFSPVDRQLLDLIDVLAAAVVTLAWITFSILVGQPTALCFHHSLTGIVFRGNQLDMLLLTEFLSVDRIQQFVVVALDFVLLAKHRLSLLQLLFLFGSGNQARRNASNSERKRAR
ncbi:hypothetical protein D3C84_700050 [compost metagenome]